MCSLLAGLFNLLVGKSGMLQLTQEILGNLNNSPGVVNSYNNSQQKRQQFETARQQKQKLNQIVYISRYVNLLVYNLNWTEMLSTSLYNLIYNLPSPDFCDSNPTFSPPVIPRIFPPEITLPTSPPCCKLALGPARRVISPDFSCISHL